MAEQIFWGVAILACMLAFGFAFRHRGVLTASLRPVHLDLAKGQEKDNWLTCAVVWAVILSGHWAGKTLLLGVGSVCLAWTAWRTLRRLVLLSR